MLAYYGTFTKGGLPTLQPWYQWQGVFTPLLTAMVCWALWWLWRFTITPRLFPVEIREYPYMMPVIGHGISFMINSQKLLGKARNHFGDSNEPLRLVLFGLNVYFVGSGGDAGEVYRKTRTLLFEEFYQRVFVSMGVSKAGVKKVFAPLPKEIQDPDNTRRQPVAHLARAMLRAQLQPGPGMDVIEHAELAYLERHIRADALRNSRFRFQPLPRDENVEGHQSIEVSLWKWCMDVTIRAAQKAFFGSALDRIDPDLPDKFLEFDDLGWKLLYQFPKFLARDTLEKRDAVRAALTKFCELPRELRDDAEGWALSAAEDKMRALDLPNEDIASFMTVFYWGMNSNIFKAAFWLICYLLHNPSLIDEIRAETDGAFAANGTMAHLDHLHRHCPRLDAVWNETLRLTGAAVSVRTVTADTVIGGRTLRAGNRLVIPYRPLQLDVRVFGPDAMEFRPERFLNKTDKQEDRMRSDHFRPFGGGGTQCPGRHITKRVTFVLVALLLRRFDISMARGHQPMPRTDDWRPFLGIVGVKPGDDMRIRLTPSKVNP